MYKPNYLMMTAGPTMVRQNVMEARSYFFGNPDLDEDFFKFYDEVTKKIGVILNAKKCLNIIMSGEGMVGLEAAVASMTEVGDEVLVIGNGVFGDGFVELITPYGGKVTTYFQDWTETICPKKLDEFISSRGKKFKYATVVHCDTPSGMLNDVEAIAKVLQKHNIISVVDSVAAMGGTKLDVDGWGLDIVMGGSQKVFSAPPGLTILAVSDRALKSMKNRKTPISSYYMNILSFENCVLQKYFPYTMPASDIISFDVALQNILDYGVSELIKKHEEVAKFTRDEIKKLGLENYLKGNWSPTVTAFLVPVGYDATEIITHMKTKYKIIIAGSYGKLAGKVLRIGHMGENIFEGRVEKTLEALGKTLEDLKK